MGEGDTLGGWAKIKDDPEGCIPPGSKIRFIIGEHGKSQNADMHFGGGTGGGGGTGILFLAPNAGNGEWQHLIIAGAGGGAYARTNRDLKREGWSGDGGYSNPDLPSGYAGWAGAGWKYSTSGAEPG